MSRPASATITTLNSRPFAPWIVKRRTAFSSSATASAFSRAERSCSRTKRTKPARSPPRIASYSWASRPSFRRREGRTVPAREHGQVVVVLREDLLAEPLEPDAGGDADEPLVPLQEGAEQARVDGGQALGQPRSSAVKSGRRGAPRRTSTSASFDTPTNGEARTVARATSS